MSTNRDVFRETPLPICEWNPTVDRLAKLSDPFHGMAIILVGDPKHNVFRVCLTCAVGAEGLKRRPRLGPIPWGGA